jgi:hypothetical protein
MAIAKKHFKKSSQQGSDDGIRLEGRPRWVIMVSANLRTINPDAVIRIRVTRPPGEAMREALKAASLRRHALPTQTVEVSWPRKLDRKS